MPHKKETYLHDPGY